jgi:hypothetical protein
VGLLDGDGAGGHAVAGRPDPGPGGGQSGAGPLPNKVAFELGQGGEDVEDELAAGGGGVDRLLEAAEPDATLG